MAGGPTVASRISERRSPLIGWYVFRRYRPYSGVAGQFLRTASTADVGPSWFRGAGDFVYGERWLAAGDTAVLIAEVQPALQGNASYREGPAPDPPAELEVVGPGRLTDTIGEELVVRSERG